MTEAPEATLDVRANEMVEETFARRRQCRRDDAEPKNGAASRAANQTLGESRSGRASLRRARRHGARLPICTRQTMQGRRGSKNERLLKREIGVVKRRFPRVLIDAQNRAIDPQREHVADTALKST